MSATKTPRNMIALLLVVGGIIFGVMAHVIITAISVMNGTCGIDCARDIPINFAVLLVFAMILSTLVIVVYPLDTWDSTQKVEK